MKKRLIEAGILTAVFIVAVAIFSYLTNRGNDDMTADMGGATLPRVYFSTDGFGVNPLNAYSQKMDIPTMRDTITPVVNQQLEMNVEAFENKISSADYTVYTIDGEEKLLEGSTKKVEEKTLVSFDENVFAEERVLELALTVDGQKIYYYTRVVDSTGFNLSECLNYVYNFHENALKKAENTGVGAAIEPSGEGDNTTFQHVTIHSDYDHVTWGELSPMVVGKERWKIVETNPTYTSVLLEYEVSCKGEENELDTYMVKEFFRVRLSAGNMYLLNYDRTMEQIFDGSQQVLSEKGILLGIAPYDAPYMINEDGTIVSFVQANELWNYNSNTDEMSLLFSFRSVENTDVRNIIGDHEIKILAVDEKGNTTFAVYGYMNRGTHEGQVGAAIYYYNIETNNIDEKIFIPSDKSAALAREELGKLVYYSVEKNLLHVLVDGTLYEIDMQKDEKTELVDHLEEDQYVVSDDGQLLAYQNGEGDEKDGSVTVENLKTGKKYLVEASEGETIRPLGFINSDFVSGTARAEDAGQTISGGDVLPMYKVEIRSSGNKVIKTYESAEVYILDVEISDGMLTLNRAVKNGNIYTSINADYITNNEEKKQSNISLDSYITELKETQMRLTFADGVQNQDVKILRPKMVMSDKPAMAEFSSESDSERYYVYGLGCLQGIYKKAGYAVQAAENVCGVVVTSSQEYVWERGNRSLEHSISGQDELILSMREQLAAGKSAMELAGEISDGKTLDLTGCTTNEILYLINKDTPVIGMIDGTNAVILTGYDTKNVMYREVSTGNTLSVPYEQMDAMLAGTGRAFIGYIR